MAKRTCMVKHTYFEIVQVLQRSKVTGELIEWYATDMFPDEETARNTAEMYARTYAGAEYAVIERTMIERAAFKQRAKGKGVE